MLSRPRVHAAMVLRALVLSGLITAMTVGAHATHEHAPSLVLIAVTAVVLVGACLPACRDRLGWGRAISTMVVGQFALHAWFAWFSLPVVGDGVTTLSPHHGPEAGVLASRDFTGLVPSPAMALLHIGVALLLAALLVHADQLLSAAAFVLRSVLGTSPEPFLDVISTPASAAMPAYIVGSHLHALDHVLVRRGPPGHCV